MILADSQPCRRKGDNSVPFSGWAAAVVHQSELVASITSPPQAKNRENSLGLSILKSKYHIVRMQLLHVAGQFRLGFAHVTGTNTL
jgi:hypothetical protein